MFLIIDMTLSVQPGGIANGRADPRPYMGAHVSRLTGGYALRLGRSDWNAHTWPMNASGTE